MQINFLKNSLLLALFFMVLYSCDTEYNLVGEDVVGDKHFDNKDTLLSVLAYNQKISNVATNNLSVHSLGVYKNSAFGTTLANVNIQVSLASYAPTIGVEPVIDSVYLYIPYFSTSTSTAANGAQTYVLDSIYGSNSSKFKLSVFESGYFMRDYDPINFKDYQLYYNDQKTDFESQLKGTRLNDDSNASQNDEFYFSEKEIVERVIKDKDTTRTRKKPGIRLKLSNSYFQDKILKADTTKLASANAFKEYFRGLYFKVESPTSTGSLAVMNLGQGTITIYYKKNTSSTDATRKDATLAINVSGYNVNFFEQRNTNKTYEDAVKAPDKVNGDSRLYIKGGEGSMAVINLFGPDANNNGVADQLEYFRNEGILINEANLVFNIDQNAMSNTYEPNRIYLYDLTNDRQLIDCYKDETKSNQSAKKNKYIYGGLISKASVSFGRGQTYKFRITNYITRLIKYKDSTNLKLGLVVTESIAITASNKLKTPIGDIKAIPQASIMNPLGTVLYGSNATTVPEDKRLRLQIYYTKKKPE